MSLSLYTSHNTHLLKNTSELELLVLWQISTAKIHKSDMNYVHMYLYTPCIETILALYNSNSLFNLHCMCTCVHKGAGLNLALTHTLSNSLAGTSSLDLIFSITLLILSPYITCNTSPLG